MNLASDIIFMVPCDECSAVFEGTMKELRKSRWIRTWRKKSRGLEQQIDLCPKCRKTDFNLLENNHEPTKDGNL